MSDKLLKSLRAAVVIAASVCIVVFAVVGAVLLYVGVAARHWGIGVAGFSAAIAAAALWSEMREAL